MVEHTLCFEIATIKRPLDELTATGVIKQLAAEFEVHTDIDIDGNQLLWGALSTGTPPLGMESQLSPDCGLQLSWQISHWAQRLSGFIAQMPAYQKPHT